MLPTNQPTLVRMPLAWYKIDRALPSGVYDPLSTVENKAISRGSQGNIEAKIYTALSSWDSEPLYHSKNGIVTLTSGWLFEFQHITCMDTDCSRMLPWFHLLEHISDASVSVMLSCILDQI